MAARMLSVSRLLSNLTTRMSSPLWINHPTIAATTAPIATYSHRLRRVFFGRGLPPTAPSPAGRGSSRTPAVLPGFRSWNRLPLRRPSSLIPGTWDATWCLYDHSKFSDIPAWSRPQPFASPPYDVLSTMTLPRGVCTNATTRPCAPISRIHQAPTLHPEHTAHFRGNSVTKNPPASHQPARTIEPSTPASGPGSTQNQSTGSVRDETRRSQQNPRSRI